MGTAPAAAPAPRTRSEAGTCPALSETSSCLKNAMGGAGRSLSFKYRDTPSIQGVAGNAAIRLVFTGKIVKPLFSAPHHLQYVSQTQLCKGFLRLHRSSLLLPQELRPSPASKSPHLPLPLVLSRCSVSDLPSYRLFWLLGERGSSSLRGDCKVKGRLESTGAQLAKPPNAWHCMAGGWREMLGQSWRFCHGRNAGALSDQLCGKLKWECDIVKDSSRAQ